MSLITEQRRNQFADMGLTYQSLNTYDLDILTGILREKLKEHNNPPLKMTLKTIRKRDLNFDSAGFIDSFYLRVKGKIKHQGKYFNHFKSREAISFNIDGFIGFAGWADSKNILPFVSAFDDWLMLLHNREELK